MEVEKTQETQETPTPEETEEMPTPEETQETPTPEETEEMPTPEETQETPIPQETEEMPTPEETEEMPTPEETEETTTPEETEETGTPEETEEMPTPEETQELPRFQEMPRFLGMSRFLGMPRFPEMPRLPEMHETDECEGAPCTENHGMAAANFVRKRPFRIMDYNGRRRIGIVASSLENLIEVAYEKLNIPRDTASLRVVLEDDGTEIWDEEYFRSLPSDTAFIILVGDETWTPGRNYSRCRYGWDETDTEEKPPPHLEKLVDKLYEDMSSIVLMGRSELEALSIMDPEHFDDLVPDRDRGFLGSVKEASFKLLTEKEEAKEAIQLLKLYHARFVGDRRRQPRPE